MKRRKYRTFWLYVYPDGLSYGWKPKVKAYSALDLFDQIISRNDNPTKGFLHLYWRRSNTYRFLRWDLETEASRIETLDRLDVRCSAMWDEVIKILGE